MIKVGMKLRANCNSWLDGVTKDKVYEVVEVSPGPSVDHFLITNDHGKAIMPIDSVFSATEGGK